jgi:hypothetical protein
MEMKVQRWGLALDGLPFVFAWKLHSLEMVPKEAGEDARRTAAGTAALHDVQYRDFLLMCKCSKIMARLSSYVDTFDGEARYLGPSAAPSALLQRQGGHEFGRYLPRRM